MSDDVPSAPVRTAPGAEVEATFAHLERHAGRILFGGGLLAANVVIVEIMRHLTGSTLGLSALTAVLTIAMFLLLHRLARRTVRFALNSARHQGRMSRSVLKTVSRFANSPAGMVGTAEALRKAADDAGCEVLLWNDAARTLTLASSGESFQLTTGTAHRLLEAMGAQRVQAVPDLSVLTWLPSDLVKRDSTCALLLAPMWSGETFVGVLFKRYQNAKLMRRSQEEGLVSALAAIGAVAIGKAMVVDREQQRARDNELLLRSMHLAREDAQQDNVGDYALQAVEAMAASQCAIYGITGGQLRLVGSHGVPRSLALAARRVSTRSRLYALLQQSKGGPRAVATEALDADAMGALAHLRFEQEVVVQPIYDQGAISGLMVLDCGRDDLGEREVALLAALSRQLAMALERRRMSRMMRKRSRHLASTPKLARALTGQRDPGAVARIAARELHDSFGFGRVSIALREGQGLRIVASAGMLAQTSEVLLSTPVLDEAFATNSPYVSCSGEGDRDARHVLLGDLNAPAGCRSQLVVPIIDSDGKCGGVVSVYERDPDALGEDDLHMLETIADQLSGTLEQAVLFETLERNYFRTVEALSAALEAKDAYTLSHARSITETSAAVGRRLGMREPEIRTLKLGALLHDIGKIGVPGEILNKPGPLTDAEFDVMKEHTIIGEQIIAPIEFLDDVRPLVLHEHERWDGKGYPHGLRGNDIPLGARIIFVCDAYHAMTSDRPYRKALPTDEARRRLTGAAGQQFDPQVVEAFFEVLEQEQGVMVGDHVADVSDSTVGTAPFTRR